MCLWVVCVRAGLAACPPSPPPPSPGCGTSVLRLPGVTFGDPPCCPGEMACPDDGKVPAHTPASAVPWGHSLRRPLTACLCFSFQAERPALNVVIFPLLHEGLTDVIRDVPMVHLDEVTLFKSRVAEEPPNLWW